MISRLIDLNITTSSPKFKLETKPLKTTFTIKDYAKSFINGMGETQRNRFKQMLENGIQCGTSVAKSYGINYDKFIKEVKNQLNIKEEL